MLHRCERRIAAAGDGLALHIVEQQDALLVDQGHPNRGGGAGDFIPAPERGLKAVTLAQVFGLRFPEAHRACELLALPAVWLIQTFAATCRAGLSAANACRQACLAWRRVKRRGVQTAIQTRAGGRAAIVQSAVMSSPWKRSPRRGSVFRESVMPPWRVERARPRWSITHFRLLVVSPTKKKPDAR